MGVIKLTKFVKQLYKKVSLKDRAGKKNIIVIDGGCISWFILETYDILFDFKLMKQKLDALLLPWIEHGYKLEIIFDSGGMWLKNGKMNQYIQNTIQDYNDSNNIIQKFSNKWMNKDDLMYNQYQYRYTVMYSGYGRALYTIIESFCNYYNKKTVQFFNIKDVEADGAVAGYAIKYSEKVYAIMTDDSDHFIFDIPNNIKIIGVRYTKLATKNQVYTYKYITKKIIWNALRIKTFKQAMLFAQIQGCDVTHKNRNTLVIDSIKKVLDGAIKLKKCVETFYKPVEPINMKSFGDKHEIKEWFCVKYYDLINKGINLMHYVVGCSNETIHDELKQIRYNIFKQIILKNDKSNTMKYKEYYIDCKLYKNDGKYKDALIVKDIDLNGIKNIKIEYKNWSENKQIKLKKDRVWMSEYVINGHKTFKINHTKIDKFVDYVVDIMETHLNKNGKYNTQIIALKKQREFNYLFQNNNDNIIKDRTYLNMYIKYRDNIYTKPHKNDIHVQSLYLILCELLTFDTIFPVTYEIFHGPLYHYICDSLRDGNNNTDNITDDVRSDNNNINFDDILNNILPKHFKKLQNNLYNSNGIDSDTSTDDESKNNIVNDDDNCDSKEASEQVIGCDNGSKYHDNNQNNILKPKILNKNKNKNKKKKNKRKRKRNKKNKCESEIPNKDDEKCVDNGPDLIDIEYLDSW